MKCNLNIEILFKYYPLYLQYNTIEGLVEPKTGYGLCQPEEAHSHPVCEGFLKLDCCVIVCLSGLYSRDRGI